MLAASALRCIGGQMQGRLIFRNEDEGRRGASASPIRTGNTSWTELAKGDVMFAATGRHRRPDARGVRRSTTTATTHSLVMRSKTGTGAMVEAHRNWETSRRRFDKRLKLRTR